MPKMKHIGSCLKDFALLFFLGLIIFVTVGPSVLAEQVTQQQEEAQIPRPPEQPVEEVPTAILETRCVPFQQFESFAAANGYKKLHTSVVVLDFNDPMNAYKNAFVSFYVNEARFFIMAFASTQAPNFICVAQGHSLKVDDWTGLLHQSPATESPI